MNMVYASHRVVSDTTHVPYKYVPCRADGLDTVHHVANYQ